jgi:hypothetical protein
MLMNYLISTIYCIIQQHFLSCIEYTMFSDGVILSKELRSTYMKGISYDPV